MTSLLPQHPTDEAFFAADAKTDYTKALRAVAQSAAMNGDVAWTRFADGSLPVFGTRDRVAKLYPPSCVAAYENERGVLEHVDGRLPIATPAVQAAGALEGWRYIVMTRLKGRPLRACFDEVPRARLGVPRRVSRPVLAPRRRVLLATHKGDELTITALERAFAVRQPTAGLIVHSDRGSEFASHGFRQVLKSHHAVQSMSRKANCYDTPSLSSLPRLRRAFSSPLPSRPNLTPSPPSPTTFATSTTPEASSAAATGATAA